MSHQDHLVELDNLVCEVLCFLKFHFIQFDVDAFIHVFVVDFWNNDPWEQITGDTLEERKVEGQEFSQVDLVDSS